MHDVVLQNERGWFGGFTRQHAPGALPNDTRIVKCAAEEGDGNPVGTKGRVLGSISHPDIADGAVFYFVEWDSMPRTAVGVIGWKIVEDKGPH